VIVYSPILAVVVVVVVVASSTLPAEITPPPLKPPQRRKQSSVGLNMNYPGDLLSQARPRGAVPPVLKRNTIADFANTKAYQASTASLISASADQGIGLLSGGSRES